jgi:hypothetical protein
MIAMSIEGDFRQDPRIQIQALVNYETKGWNSKNPDLFLSIIHPDMVWPWPPHADAHDPADWVFELGHFDRIRWRKNWQDIFDNHDLIRNKIENPFIRLSLLPLSDLPWMVAAKRRVWVSWADQAFHVGQT